MRWLLRGIPEGKPRAADRYPRTPELLSAYVYFHSRRGLVWAVLVGLNSRGRVVDTSARVPMPSGLDIILVLGQSGVHISLRATMGHRGYKGSR